MGLITIIRFLYMFAGTEKELIYGISTDYKVFQIVNCLCVPIIVFFGNKIATELCGNDDKTRANVGIVHSIFMLFALPIFFYTPYVYGEVISATMEILFIWAGICSLKYEQKRIIYFAVMVLSGVIGYFARANFIIVPIAYLCVSLVSAVYRKKIRQLLAPIIILALLVISSRINILYYERISGIRFDQGVPIQCYIAMGLDEYSPVAPGWYNGRNVETYVNANYDKEAAKEAAGNYIHDRLVMFKNGAGISPLVFYKEKMFSQWADATMNCFIETKVHIPEARTWIMDISDPDGKYAAPIRRIMDECQLCMMIGCLLFAVFQLFSKDCKPYKLFIVTILFGGFVFSMIWEAMGRYIFPYYICMLSLAPSGVAMLCNRVISLFCKNRSER